MSNRACPSCPDGYVWNSSGQTPKECPTCKGKAYLGDDDYCECDLELTEDEQGSGKCSSCGKLVLT